MRCGEHDTEDLQPWTAPCRSPVFQPCTAPSVPEVSLIFNSGPSINTRPPTSTHGAPGNLYHETSVTERKYVGSVGHARDHAVLNCGLYRSPYRERNKLLHHLSHKPDEISGIMKSDYFNFPSATVLKDNSKVESEVITNSKTSFLPGTFSNKSISCNKNNHCTQQNYCACDNSVSNRKPDKSTNQQNGSQNTRENNSVMSLKSNQDNESDNILWNVINGNRNFFGCTYQSGDDKCRMEKSNYKRQQKESEPQRKFSSYTESELKSRLYCHKETSSPMNCVHHQIECLNADSLCIPQERTVIECVEHSQNCAANDQKVSRSSSLSHKQENDRDISESSCPDVRQKNEFSLHFVTHHPGNHELETRIDSKSLRNQIQSLNFGDGSEVIDASKAHKANVKGGESQDKSMFDLYSLLHSQNEQLKLLQAQVDRLLLMRERSISVSTSPCGCLPFRGTGIQSANKHVTVVNESTQTVHTDSQCDVAVNTDPIPLVSVGVMTSLTEASDTQQPQKMKRITRLSTDCLQCPEPAAESTDETMPVYFNSIDLPAVQEHAPSPVSSIHVDMPDYEDDDDDDDDYIGGGDGGTEIDQQFPCSKADHMQQRKSEGANRIGWTFYNNVVGHVNKLLKDLPHDNEECDAEQDSQKLRESQEDVKNATVDQLRKMGISFNNFCGNDAPAEVGRPQQFDSVHCPRLGIMPITVESSESDTSMQINTLALKYLKHDDRGKEADRMQDLTFYSVAMKTTNLSLGKVKYLERYHLLPSQGEGVAEIKDDRSSDHDVEKGAERQTGPGIGVRDEAKVKVPYHQRQSSTNKILDITALKKQPKLL